MEQIATCECYLCIAFLLRNFKLFSVLQHFMLHTRRSISYIIFPWLPTFDFIISSYFSHTNNCFKLSKFCFILHFLNDVVHLFMCSFSISVYPFWLDVFCCPVFCICSLGHAGDTHSYLAVPSVCVSLKN